jgi:hypothetical protein
MKRLREDADLAETLIVNQAAICALVNFYDSDEIVQACRNSLNASVFDGQYEYYVGVRNAAAAVAERPELFNTSFFHDGMHRELVRARDYVYIMGGVVWWAVKDLARWLQMYANAADDTERRNLGLPFGVLEAWDYWLEIQQTLGRQWTYVVHPISKDDSADGSKQKKRGGAAAADCTYVFYNYRTTLLPLNGDDLATYERRAGPLLLVAQENGGAGVYSYRGYSAARQRVPQSPFYNLATTYEQLEEALLNLMDGDWLRAHPKPVLRVGMPAPTPMEKTSDAALYAGRSPLEASLSDQRRLRSMNLQQMANLLNTVRHLEGISSKRDTPRQRQRAFYRRADMLDDAELFEDTVELAHWSDPAVLNDYTQRLADYKISVVTAMGLGENSRFAQAILGKLAREESGLGSKSHMAMLVERNERNAVIESEQKIYSRLFNVAYELCGFRRHDAETVSALVASLDAIVQEEAARRAAAKNLARLALQFTAGVTPERAADQLLRRPSDEEEKARRAMQKELQQARDDDDSEVLYNLRVKLADLRAWLAHTLEAPRNVNAAELIFENKEENAIKLQFLQEMSLQGMVSAKTLEKQARLVYGTENMNLQEPPKPEKPAGKK